jgi:hypothetical protein
MDSRRRDRNGKEPEVERYREAALVALDQLEWCIDYLRTIRKGSIAQSLDRNRRTIIERHQLPR